MRREKASTIVRVDTTQIELEIDDLVRAGLEDLAARGGTAEQVEQARLEYAETKTKVVDEATEKMIEIGEVIEAVREKTKLFLLCGFVISTGPGVDIFSPDSFIMETTCGKDNARASLVLENGIITRVLPLSSFKRQGAAKQFLWMAEEIEKISRGEVDPDPEFCPLFWEGENDIILAGKPDLRRYDTILINTSAGKDSQAMLDYVVRLAESLGVKDRVVAVHADLGRVEWGGVPELAEEQARHYGVRFIKVKRVTEDGVEQDLLEHIEDHGKFPGPQQRFCTSDHKRQPIYKVITSLAREVRQKLRARGSKRKPSLLNCLGLRAQESRSRANTAPYRENEKRNTSLILVHDWLPIHEWKVEQVWETIHKSGVRHHWAYDIGMPRLSCIFCFYAPRNALIIAGKRNKDLLKEYVRVEAKIGHTFKSGKHGKIAEILEAVERDEKVELTDEWGECY